MSKLFAVGSYVKYVGVPFCPRITALLKDCTGVVVRNMVYTIEVKWLNATGEYASRNGKHITEALAHKAPEFGPVPTCNEDFNATTVAAAQLGEVLVYLPFQKYSGPVVDYIRKVQGGIWFHFSNDVYRNEASKATGAVVATGSNWVYFNNNAWFVQTATWLGGMHGNFVPAFEWPAFPHIMEKAFNNCYLNGEQQ